MWQVRRLQNGEGIVLRLIGRLQGDQLNELQDVLAAEASAQGFTLDLADVKLVDQDAIRFLADCEARGTRLQNCPDYIREWIAATNTNKEATLDQS